MGSSCNFVSRFGSQFRNIGFTEPLLEKTYPPGHQGNDIALDVA